MREALIERIQGALDTNPYFKLPQAISETKLMRAIRDHLQDPEFFGETPMPEATLGQLSTIVNHVIDRTGPTYSEAHLKEIEAFFKKYLGDDYAIRATQAERRRGFNIGMLVVVLAGFATAAGSDPNAAFNHPSLVHIGIAIMCVGILGAIVNRLYYGPEKDGVTRADLRDAASSFMDEHPIKNDNTSRPVSPG